MHQVTWGGRKEDALWGEDNTVSGRGVTAWSPDRGRSPAQCGTACLRQTEPWCSSCTHPVPLSPRPARNRHTVIQLAGTTCSADAANGPTFHLRHLSSLYFGGRRVIWTDQSRGSLPFCSCHRGPSARRPAPARQCTHYHPGERWHKRSEIQRG